MADPLDRREFLGRAAWAAAGVGAASQLGWLSACGSSEPAPSPPTDASVASLARMLDGRVVGPHDAAYVRARQLNDPRFDGVKPRAIAYLESPDDAGRAITWARENDVPIVARNGGHSYGGYSTVDGLVADVTRMHRIEVDKREETALIGAGSLLIDVYAELARHGVMIPAGSCPTVGISGLTLGGGIGLSGRELGLTCDNLLEVQVVTASGEQLTANEDEHPDLFWASRGGGGGNFGIVTALTFSVHPARDVAIYDFEWPWSDARAVFDAWQHFAPNAPDELFSICKLANASPATGGGPGRPAITSYGQYFGSASELESLLEPLLEAARPSSRMLSEKRFLDAQVYWAGCEGSAADCVRTTKRASYKAKSAYVGTIFPGEAIDTMIRWIERWPGSGNPAGAAIQMDASGGAINRVPPDATAFVHRDDLFHCQFLAYWAESDPRSVVDADLAWISDFYDAMAPFVSGGAYQNYIDPELEGQQQAYYGANYERLQRVNAEYDPDQVFAYPHSVS